MKITKTITALCVLGAALLAFAGCKDNSGDGDTAAAIAGIKAKHALSMTVDATTEEIKVGKKAINDSNEGTEVEILANTDEGKATSVGHEAEQQRCGKRFFKEISAGLNNTEGFRTNVVLNKAEGTWRNSDTGRTAGAGLLFDFNKYGDTYDFFFISFKPVFSADGSSITSVNAYFERYSGVKKYKAGIYTSHTAASALGSNYIQTAVGTWNSTLFTPAQGRTWQANLTQGNGYTTDSLGNIIIGLDVKQLTDENGLYTVRIGNIVYTTADGSAATFNPLVDPTKNSFNMAWKTSFVANRTFGKGGERENSSIEGYANWTHVDKKNKSSNLKGAVLAYGFAPYGTKPVASFYTCGTPLSSGKTDNTSSAYDYVGDWNVANEIDAATGAKTTVVYEEGGVVHEYVEY